MGRNTIGPPWSYN